MVLDGQDVHGRTGKVPDRHGAVCRETTVVGRHREVGHACGQGLDGTVIVDGHDGGVADGPCHAHVGSVPRFHCVLQRHGVAHGQGHGSLHGDTGHGLTGVEGHGVPYIRLRTLHVQHVPSGVEVQVEDSLHIAGGHIGVGSEVDDHTIHVADLHVQVPAVRLHRVVNPSLMVLDGQDVHDRAREFPHGHGAHAAVATVEGGDPDVGHTGCDTRDGAVGIHRDHGVIAALDEHIPPGGVPRFEDVVYVKRASDADGLVEID